MLYPLSYEGGEALRIPGWAYWGVAGRPCAYVHVRLAVLAPNADMGAGIDPTIQDRIRARHAPSASVRARSSASEHTSTTR